MKRVSIIGSAGRAGDAKRMTLQLYNAGICRAKDIIKRDFGLSFGEVQLVSGGSSWTDHIAVALFLDSEEPSSSLTLHLPARWLQDKCRYDEDASGGKAGHRLNQLHTKFSKQLRQSSLADIGSAVSLGAQIHVHDNFHKRNEAVAMSDYVIAIAWGEGAQPQKGGTLDTWKMCRSRRKTYVSYESLKRSLEVSSTAHTAHSTGKAIASDEGMQQSQPKRGGTLDTWMIRKRQSTECVEQQEKKQKIDTGTYCHMP